MTSLRGADAPVRTPFLAAALTLAGLALLLVAPVRAELQIAITADPPLPVPNLMQNAEFEAGDETKPEGWGASTSVPDAGSFARLAVGGRGGAFVRVESFTSTTNAYLSQVAQVRPDTLYRAGAWVRMRGGTMVMWLHAWVSDPEGDRREKRFDERAYLHSWGFSSLVPDFVRLAWTDSPSPEEWLWVGREFATWPGQTQVNMHLGAYFDRSSMDIDGAFMGLARTTLKLQVTGGPIARVRVLDDVGEQLWDSADLGGAEALTHEIADLPTDTRYRIVATQADGTEVAAWYPEEQ